MKKSLLIIGLLITCTTSHAEERWLGDANGDNKVNVTDVTTLLNILQGKAAKPKLFTHLDINEDGKLDLKDVAALVDIVLGKTESKKVWLPEGVVVDPDKGGSFD